MTVPAGTPVGIVLAAGESRRTSRPKLLEPLDGATAVERVVATLRKAEKVQEVLVVVPPGRTEAFRWLEGPRVHLVESPAPSKGMISSIRAGLATPWAEGRDFLIWPADVPFVKPELVDRLVVEFLMRPGARIVIPCYRRLGGHPGYFAASLQQEFFLRGEQAGTREILLRHRAETVRWNVHDPDVCFDLDTDEDLRIATDPGARWARVERDVEARSRGGPGKPGQ